MEKISTLKDFQVLNKLGQGAFGQVFKVKRKTDSKIYALKKVKIGAMKQKERQNALNQIRILASYDGENIIGFKDSFYDETSSTLCIVMEFASGGDILRQVQSYIKSRTKFKQQEIWKALVHMTKGLKSLHQKKILHRDLKCANVFVTEDKIYKLGDLNVSKVLKKDLAVTQTGTPYYASPQVWKDKPYGVKSDIWSLGCVLYQMAALRPPFTANDLQSLYKKIVAGYFERIPSIYSNQLATVISSLLKVDPNLRPDTQKILSNPFVHKNYKGEIGNPVQKLQQCDQLLKTIKYNPYDLKGLKKLLPKSNYDQEAIQQEIQEQPEPKKKSVEKNYPLNQKKLQQYLQKRYHIQQQQSRQKMIDSKQNSRDSVSKNRQRVMSACGIRPPAIACQSPRVAVHKQSDTSKNVQQSSNYKNDPNPKMPPKPKPQKPGQMINYKLPPKPMQYQQTPQNKAADQNRSREKIVQQNKSKEKQTKQTSSRPSTSGSRGLPRSNSAKVIYPSWWG